uniref:Uncharacterized protein n=1 Tax=Siphoviridae sp. ctFn287 TaxID=2826215 RepID=A0A8S5LVA4_9CAUD|nr:MAG TPA: hypothetical protein [Siphoviridae sp. ctFn287]
MRKAELWDILWDKNNDFNSHFQLLTTQSLYINPMCQYINPVCQFQFSKE